MTKNQEIVMWCGLIILLVYLFTDRNFKAAIFGDVKTVPVGAQLDSATTTASAWDYPSTATMPAPAAKKTTLA